MDKQAIRDRVWDALEERGVARFPFPPHDRIPNFEHATRAARRLTETAVWDAAETVKANPDSPQLPVRRAALELLDDQQSTRSPTGLAAAALYLAGGGRGRTRGRWTQEDLATVAGVSPTTVRVCAAELDPDYNGNGNGNGNGGGS